MPPPVPGRDGSVGAPDDLPRGWPRNVDRLGAVWHRVGGRLAGLGVGHEEYEKTGGRAFIRLTPAAGGPAAGRGGGEGVAPTPSEAAGADVAGATGRGAGPATLGEVRSGETGDAAEQPPVPAPTGAAAMTEATEDAC